MLLIPIRKGKPNLTQGVSLEGADYTFRFQWNMRAGWYIAISDQLGVPLFSPRALVPNTDFLARVRFDARTPPGSLYLADLQQGEAQVPGFLDLVAGTPSDLQGRFALFYMTSAEIAAL